MRVIGWILIFFAAITLVAVITTASVNPDKAASASQAVLLFGVLGAFLISRANKKEKESKEKDDWDNNKYYDSQNSDSKLNQ